MLALALELVAAEEDVAAAVEEETSVDDDDGSEIEEELDDDAPGHELTQSHTAFVASTVAKTSVRLQDATTHEDASRVILYLLDAVH